MASFRGWLNTQAIDLTFIINASPLLCFIIHHRPHPALGGVLPIMLQDRVLVWSVWQSNRIPGDSDPRVAYAGPILDLAAQHIQRDPAQLCIDGDYIGAPSTSDAPPCALVLAVMKGMSC